MHLLLSALLLVILTPSLFSWAPSDHLNMEEGALLVVDIDPTKLYQATIIAHYPNIVAAHLKIHATSEINKLNTNGQISLDQKDPELKRSVNSSFYLTKPSQVSEPGFYYMVPKSSLEALLRSILPDSVSIGEKAHLTPSQAHLTSEDGTHLILPAYDNFKDPSTFLLQNSLSKENIEEIIKGAPELEGTNPEIPPSKSIAFIFGSRSYITQLKNNTEKNGGRRLFQTVFDTQELEVTVLKNTVTTGDVPVYGRTHYLISQPQNPAALLIAPAVGLDEEEILTVKMSEGNKGKELRIPALAFINQMVGLKIPEDKGSSGLFTCATFEDVSLSCRKTNWLEWEGAATKIIPDELSSPVHPIDPKFYTAESAYNQNSATFSRTVQAIHLSLEETGLAKGVNFYVGTFPFGIDQFIDDSHRVSIRSANTIYIEK